MFGKFIFTEIMSDHRRIERDISRRQVKVRDLQAEIQRMEHFLGDKKSYLTSLKETLVHEYNEIQKQEKLRSAIDSRHVSLICLMFYLVQGVTSVCYL